jgi:hypothetical protein
MQILPESNLIDGDPTTAWHSVQSPAPSVEEINLTLDNVRQICRVCWLAAEDAEHAAPLTFEIDVSADGRASTTVVRAGRWREMAFPPVSARQLRLRSDTRLLQVDYTLKIAELTVEEQTAATDVAELAWTAPGDDAMRGTAYEYQLRRSMRPIQSAADWAAAEPVVDIPPAPAPAGTPQSMRLQSSGGDGPVWYYALVAIDQAGNASPASNNVAPQSSAHDGAGQKRIARSPEESSAEKR